MTNGAEEFVKLGVQYYVSARLSAQAGQLPVCGNLFHHAVEMFLKSYFSKTLTPHAVLDISRHNLNKLWADFKAAFPSEPLGQFDSAVAGLHKFESIRYPDRIVGQGAQMQLDWASTPVPATFAPGIAPPPAYRLNVSEIDGLVCEVMRLTPWNPIALSPTMPKAQEGLAYQNAKANVWGL